MNALGFAWRSLVRQPARATLAVLGVAAIGALLFDMLLLSNGLVTSMRDLFDQAGFDLRVTATDTLPGQGPSLPRAAAEVEKIAAVPGVKSAYAIRLATAFVEVPGARPLHVSPQGVTGSTRARASTSAGTSTSTGASTGPGPRPWTLMRGRDLIGDADLLVNENTARQLHLEPGTRVTLRASCAEDQSLPPVPFVVSGVADFPFDSVTRNTAAVTMDAADAVCGGNDAGQADVIMVATEGDESAASAAPAVAAAVPHLTVLTNEDLVGRLERGGFSYFRQTSAVLTTVTIAFAALLIAVLLTVSVNQRLGEIAALRALGFTRWRAAADVLCESSLIVGIGGVLSLPLGLALARGLDDILKDIPGIPADVHFFVFQPAALQIHASLLVVTALLAALYPVRIVSRLPIAATLRHEVNE